ncbi:hypothetical protein I6E68_09445 [Salinibacterium sp. NSLL150]|uniref:hypothetical protein n=1 Tax=unclassified Salinibacterium TaxID=2632331 RepID=UPI0018CD1CDE|nr:MULTISPECIES: hypothetical protein [unclassified Salinibacterium]MBH0099363.1 hypothetical protein [Salinibacterium sp. NSLL35]MBH0102117.1 hypothetical protein [Salinibacterium sp. NSLL150]MBH0104877.1 hypothetical protein [Salinibacterium sp. NSLL16]MBH0107637.1 hypothetical protein [Salinibacterium sp. NSLL17]
MFTIVVGIITVIQLIRPVVEEPSSNLISSTPPTPVVEAGVAPSATLFTGASETGSRNFQITIDIINYAASKDRIWVVILAPNDLYYPQSGVIPRTDGSQTLEVIIGTEDEHEVDRREFTVFAYLMSAEDSETLNAALRSGNGLDSMPDSARILDGESIARVNATSEE